MIQIKALNKKELGEFIVSDEFKEMPHLPISTHRAISHMHNPRANTEDVLLLLAYEESDLVGYLGVLADRIQLKEKEDNCGWLSCIWVNPKHRGKQIAYQMVMSAFDHWDNKIVITEFTAPAQRLYDKTKKFSPLKTLEGIRIYRRLDLQKILPPKHPFFRKTKNLLRIIDSLTNLILDLRFPFYNIPFGQYQLEVASPLNEADNAFLEKHIDAGLFQRKVIDWNWILKYPWIKNGNPTDESKRYHFSSLDKSFQFQTVRLKNKESETVAMLLCAIRNGHLRIPFCYYECDKNQIVQLIRHLMKKWKINTLSSYRSDLNEVLKKNSKEALYSKKISRAYLISNALAEKLDANKLFIADGDGDCSFT